MVDIFPIKRRTSGKAVSEKDILPYLQREIAPELKSIRTLLDLMIAGNLEASFRFTSWVGLQTAGAPTFFTAVDTDSSSVDQAVRLAFDESHFTVVNLSRTRGFFLEVWLSATGGGGSPEVALFDGAAQIADSVVAHSGGTTAVKYEVGPLTLPSGPLALTVKGRDPNGVVDVVVESARMIVRYEDTE